MFYYKQLVIIFKILHWCYLPMVIKHWLLVVLYYIVDIYYIIDCTILVIILYYYITNPTWRQQ